MASDRKPFDHGMMFYLTLGGVWGALLVTDFAWGAAMKPAAIFFAVWWAEWAWYSWRMTARVAGAWRAFTRPSTEAPRP